jgi:hypothetical protein
MTTPARAESINWTGKGAKDRGVGAATRDFVALDGRYILGLNGTGIEIEVARLRRTTWGELQGELAVRCALAGARTIDEHHTISVADFAVSSLRARQERAKHLIARSQAPTIDWYGLLEEFCGRVLAAERTGQPAVMLRDVPAASPRDVHVVDGFRLPRRHASVLAGAEGAAKSILALHIGGTLAARGIPTLFLDWELDAPDHSARLAALFGDTLPPLVYVRCRGRLVDEADRIAGLIATHRVEYLIVDSVSWASDDLLDSASAQGFYAVLRRFGLGSLSIAHKAKHDDDHRSIYGSTFWMAGTRALWMVQRSAQAPAGVVELACYPRKNTFGALGDAIGLRLTFDEGGRIHVATFDAASASDLAAGVPLIQRIRSAVTSGARIRAELAGQFEDVKAETFRRTLSRAIERGQLVAFRNEQGLEQIGLPARRES